MQYNKDLCEERHKQNEKEHEAMKELMKMIHEGDERFIAREVLALAQRLEKLEEMEEKLMKLEKWRWYLTGAFAGLLLLTPIIVKALLFLVAA